MMFPPAGVIEQQSGVTMPVIESYSISGSSGDTTPPATIPSGVTAGDLLLALVGLDEQAGGGVTFPAGWTLQAYDADGGSVDAGTGIWTRVADGTEVDFDFTTTYARDTTCNIFRISGVNATTPVHVVSLKNSMGGSLYPWNCSTLTTTVDQCLCFFVIANTTGAINVVDTSANWTVHSENKQNDCTVAFAYKEMASAGAAGDFVYNNDSTSGGIHWHSIAIAG